MVYRRHARPIVRYLAVRLGPDQAEDAAHEVFLKAFNARAGYRPQSSSALPWLYGIAARVIADQHRQETRQMKALQAARGQEAGSRRRDVGADSGVDERLLEGLRALTLADRETLLLIAWGELTYEEVAATLGVPIGTVRSRVSRSRAQLRDRITTLTLNGDAHA